MFVFFPFFIELQRPTFALSFIIQQFFFHSSHSFSSMNRKNMSLLTLLIKLQFILTNINGLFLTVMFDFIYLFFYVLFILYKQHTLADTIDTFTFSSIPYHAYCFILPHKDRKREHLFIGIEVVSIFSVLINLFF